MIFNTPHDVMSISGVQSINNPNRLILWPYRSQETEGPRSGFLHFRQLFKRPRSPIYTDVIPNVHVTKHCNLQNGAKLSHLSLLHHPQQELPFLRLWSVFNIPNLPAKRHFRPSSIPAKDISALPQAISSLKMADSDAPLAHGAEAFSFVDFPEDVQLSILSFLSLPEISSFSLTSKRFLPLARPDSQLWCALCHRRWSTKTDVRAWGNGKISFHLLFKTLSRYENLIGFWRRMGSNSPSPAAPGGSPLVFFEWGPSYITGSRLSPSRSNGYGVVKTPFIWIGLSSRGEPLNFVGSSSAAGDFAHAAESGISGDPDMVPVNVSFVGKSHVVLDENLGYYRRNDFGITEDGVGRESSSSAMGGSPPEHVMSEIYQYFANRTSPGADRSSRRQRRRDKARQGRRKWESEHYVKTVNCFPTPARPLQGLWKGICDDMRLDFYLVVYDDIGGIICRKFGNSSEPVFWTSNTAFIESPFSGEELALYESRIHVRPRFHNTVNQIAASDAFAENESVSRVLCINSSYDLVLHDLTNSSADHRLVEGRIWQYPDGTFGFGFLRNNLIIDMKHIAQDGQLLDAVEHCCD
ncbi:hypothetical protein ACLOJK_035997 [Asimina triloba]